MWPNGLVCSDRLAEWTRTFGQIRVRQLGPGLCMYTETLEGNVTHTGDECPRS